MNSFILNIESERARLINALEDSGSKRAKLFSINNFFSILLRTNDNQLTESYFAEFTDLYYGLIADFEPLYIDPHITENIINQSQQILEQFSSEQNERWVNAVNNLKQRLIIFVDFLEGKTDLPADSRFFFPVLEDIGIIQNDICCGIVESISVQIKKTDSKNNFNIIPGERELENKIKNQIERSWLVAFNYVQKIIKKLPKYHDVIISFDKKWGVVEGNSLGIALTLAFIKELLSQYNAPFLFKAPHSTAYTGGLISNGGILPVSEKIIKAKTTAVFYSDIKTFAVPSDDLSEALNTLLKLNEKYPERKLKVRGVEDFEDLISRRNLVDIKKINPVIRGGKFALKHSLSIILIFILAGVVLLSGLLDFDDNPSVIAYENQHIRVYNKNKKMLWSEKVGSLSDYVIDTHSIKRKYAFLVDIDNDGMNELILSNRVYQSQSQINSLFANEIVCFDKNKNLLWEFVVDTVVYTNNAAFKDSYSIRFIGIQKIDSLQVLFVIANNFYFPCAVFGIDIKTGKRVTDIFWHSGQLSEGIIFPDDSFEKRKIILAGINNGFESSTIMILDLDHLTGQALAPKNYYFKDIKPAHLNEYALVPPTDYARSLGYRYNAVATEQLIYLPDKNLFRLALCEEPNGVILGAHIYYHFNPDLSVNYIETADEFQVSRDKLVNEGKLSPPLTYTSEYFEILKNNIKYWDGEKFVSAREYFNKK